MKQFVKKALPLMMMLALVGCQSTQLTTAINAPMPLMEVSQEVLGDMSAKEQVQAGVKSLLRTSFSYQTYVYLAPKEVAEDELSETACEEIHDKAYIALSKKATNAGLDISADDYIGEREMLKADFLACQKSRAENSNESDLGEELAQLLAELAQLTGQPLPDFQDEQVTADRQKLIHAYFLNTSKLGVKGTYQPLKGVISALPSFEYQFGQASVMVNQPIYVDMKSGDIYLWADNLALANATWLDKKLGNAWQNKWLRVPLNDGSLPNDFVKVLLKSYVNAQSRAFDELMDELFGYVTADDVLVLHDKFDDGAKTHIGSADTIIRQTQTKDTKRVMARAIAKHLYDEMTRAYPVLLENPTALDKKQETLTLNSRTLMQSVFAKLKVQASNELEEVELDESVEVVAETAGDGEVLFADGEVVEEVAKVSDIPAEETTEPDVVTDETDDQAETDHVEVNVAKTQDRYYGFDKRGRLLWVYEQKEQALPASWLKDPVDLGLLTVLDGRVSGQMFGRLPSDVAIPTHNNSVNVLEYSNTLYNTLQKSDSIFLRSFLYYLTSAFASEDKEKQADGEDKAEAESQVESNTNGDNVEK